MRNLQIIGLTLGILLLILGGAELLPALADWGRSPNAYVFLASALVSLFFGGALFICNRGCRRAMTPRGAFLLTTVTWVAFSVFAAIPLYLSDLGISFVDALFETTSGITTTGSTVLVGLDGLSAGVLLWRSVVQWIGGVGIIGFALVVLPFLRVGGMQLLRTESSDKSDKIMPRARQVAGSILLVYVGLTVLIALTYHLLGMSGFDAVNHAMTTISTAGYSTHDASFAHFDSYALDMAGAVFMLMAGVPFLLYVRFVFRGEWAFWGDEQVRVLAFVVGGLVAVVTLWLWAQGTHPLEQAFRHGAFTVASLITTTGYASTDYLAWGPFAAMLFLMVTYLGAGAGSTCGGLKTMRLILCVRGAWVQCARLVYPKGMFPVRYQGKVVAPEVIDSVFGFLGLYVAANVAFALVLAWMGLDLATAVSGAATAVANVGPGIGTVIGPAGNFATLPDAAKLALAAAMLLGRLEIMTVLVLFTRGFWRA
ncbi:MAG TPA: potassium transporter TrkH [Rhodospirillaceae bacterium]|jgi:trk system potassium uptake protein TrkH|nr:TrkH family potassium uptake protein [Alphaproteobacteria bacterium]HBH25790.1 potassium transporter TrkH [Rhodospirillaceae bacterium]